MEEIEALIAEAKSCLNNLDQLTPVEQEENSEISVTSHEERTKSEVHRMPGQPRSHQSPKTDTAKLEKVETDGEVCVEGIESLIAEAKSCLNNLDQLTPVEREENPEISVTSHEEWTKSEVHRMPGQPRSHQSPKTDTAKLEKVETDGEVCVEGIESLIAEAKSCLNNLDQLTPVEREENPEISVISHEERTKSEVHRMRGQSTKTDTTKLEKVETDREVCVVKDISFGLEKFPVRAMNGVDNDHPPKFTYITSTIFPSWYKPVNPAGCNCGDDCPDSPRCPCIKKCGGKHRYTESGLLMKLENYAVHECGPLCRCLPTCKNRVSQQGQRYRLEIFKTDKMGWGVRSLDPIPKGAFICEYVGEFLQENEAEQRIGKDEYLLDIYRSRGGWKRFSIDSANYGNVGRFINHSCSHNSYTQKVMYDHDDEKMPHLVIFATKNIAPLEEIFYDYKYIVGSVSDAKGNVKIKACHCGSRKCKKRLY